MKTTPNFDVDFSSNRKAAEEVIDYAIMVYNGESTRQKEFSNLYLTYQGFMKDKANEAIVKSTGYTSRTKFIPYRLGRGIMRTILGEYDMIPLDFNIYTLNPEARNKKMEKYYQALGMMHAAPVIEEMQKQGVPVFQGVQPPTEEYVEKQKNIKLESETIMQLIANLKKEREGLKMKFKSNFTRLAITSEMAGKIEKKNGIVTYRPINPENMIFLESDEDPFCQNTPFVGERRKMFKHEILNTFNLTKDEILRLDDWENNPDKFDHRNYETYNSQYLLFYIYTIQWVGKKTVRLKVSMQEGNEEPIKRIISKEEYKKKKNQIMADVAAGKYELHEFQTWTIYEGTKIGNMFVDIHEKEDNIIRNVYSKKPVLEFDYCIGLLDTIYGHRISLFKMIAELDHVYDTIRYMINKELSKIKGSALQYDLALLPKTKSLSKVIHEIAEDGIITFNSSAEGNEANVDATSTGGTGVRQVNIGSGEVLLSLMQSAMDVERTMERITGINQARQGLEKASTTATTSQNNVQASRSMTYDLFKFMDDYTKMVMEKVIEKTKINQEELVDGNYDMILSDEQISYLKNSKDLLFENFGVYMADGRKNQMIMERMDILFQQEINGGYITSWDIFNFWRSDTVADAAKVIEKAKDRMMQARQQDQQSQQQMQQQNLEAQRQMMLEDREDKQAHEIEIEKMKAMIKTGQDMAKIAVDENNLKQQMSHEQSLERMRQRGM